MKNMENINHPQRDSEREDGTGQENHKSIVCSVKQNTEMQIRTQIEEISKSGQPLILSQLDKLYQEKVKNETVSVKQKTEVQIHAHIDEICKSGQPLLLSQLDKLYQERLKKELSTDVNDKMGTDTTKNNETFNNVKDKLEKHYDTKNREISNESNLIENKVNNRQNGEPSIINDKLGKWCNTNNIKASGVKPKAKNLNSRNKVTYNDVKHQKVKNLITGNTNTFNDVKTKEMKILSTAKKVSSEDVSEKAEYMNMKDCSPRAMKDHYLKIFVAAGIIVLILLISMTAVSIQRRAIRNRNITQGTV